eukprot:Gregarina_sp_Poly_1__1467@NODE_1368_length_4281_cov_169_927860_g916_i0_p1_GENE_NODE_1368_length_4281_cov_169_927860_g916_i0NODE_1368_length_4281_cov_169_927860_g916_i0_p1_ORF_typecomplete_len184_score25_12CoaE/PF01121_20/1_1e46PRK/PF00485_18/0_00035PRK/PF00485_18/0_009AAA_33/PF13671_6/1_1e07AAA_18/PF13238_6/5_8e07CPT/PF07931_12/3e06Zeta_toxin/PF06414_12/5_8e05AAA_22/PF13401_6/0_0003dNK/PF01712_19/0_11dNK/PF01712_19/22AAA_17/PF13207_6/0_0035KAP_NTPase/PF07693_14/0_0054GTP_EFTU/PF00009_27/0_0068AA
MQNKKRIIGVCGSIASGKSTLCKAIRSAITEEETLYLEADIIAHQCYAAGTKLNEAIVQEFGLQVRGQDGNINRKALAEIVFSSATSLAKLNAMVWPAIADEVRHQCAMSSATIIFIDAALLVDAGWHVLCDEVWYIRCSQEVCVKRCLQRNALLKEEDIIKRYDAQMTAEQVIEALNGKPQV